MRFTRDHDYLFDQIFKNAIAALVIIVGMAMLIHNCDTP